MQIDFNYRALGISIRYACVPWAEYLRMYGFYSAQYGFSQSAERIVERGGLGIIEAVSLGYDNPLVVWFASIYPKKDSEWVKVALQFDTVQKTFRWRILTEEEYRSLNIFERVADDYDKE